PVGISFFTFSVLSYLFDVYRGRSQAAGSLLDCAVYVSFFPKLISGPIVTWKDFEPQLRNHPMSSELVFDGGRRFLVGLAKKVLLANTLGTSFYAISARAPGELSMLAAWIGALSYSLMLYFDFSGYSDMAIGLGQIFGFKMPENFLYPYASGSMTDFWRAWHVSLGGWFRDYVYIPLGGSRAGKSKTIRNLALVWLLTGLWHGANWTFIFWGVYHGCLLLLEKFTLKSYVEKLPNWLRHLLTVVLAVIGWVFFFSPSLGSAFAFLGAMFSGPITDSFGRYCFSGSWLVLLVCGIGCLPYPRLIARNLFHSRSILVKAVSLAFFGVLLYFCTAGMLSDTYASFLYFQF
ncbi:MAG: MBOAT family protein, partial [Oscillospiraceae bacterium]|nr:MBOAT family protein [Oscillospiraceae bacterium]